MKLYRQYLDAEGIATEQQLIADSGSLEELKREAQRLAALDGCIEYAWLSGSDSNPRHDFPYELSVNDAYRFVIRDW